MQNEFILIEKLSLHTSNTIILKQIDLVVGEGESVAIIGANGSGKTTLLKLLAGILRPTEGKIQIAGLQYTNTEQSCAIKHLIGYAPDTPALYPNDTVNTYLEFIAGIKGIAKTDLGSSIDSCLENLDLLSVRDSRICTLSKGTQQRVNLAQALLHKPKILILDEPTTALDAEQCQIFCQLLKRLQAQNITLVVASHQYNDVIPICSYMLKIQNGTVNKIMLPLTNQEIRETNDQLNYST